jgi:hypothetical protein
MDLPIPVGRDLDTAVARRVMGWQNCGDDEPFRFHAERGGCIVQRGPMKFRSADSCVPDAWSPSTDIVAAMDVLCKARGPSVRPFVIQSILAGRYWCVIGKPDDCGEGTTISEAICRAALAGVM